MNITLKIRGASLALALLIIMNVRVRASALPGGFSKGDAVRLTLKPGLRFEDAGESSSGDSGYGGLLLAVRTGERGTVVGKGRAPDTVLVTFGEQMSGVDLVGYDLRPSDIALAHAYLEQLRKAQFAAQVTTLDDALPKEGLTEGVVTHKDNEETSSAIDELKARIKGIVEEVKANFDTNRDIGAQIKAEHDKKVALEIEELKRELKLAQKIEEIKNKLKLKLEQELDEKLGPLRKKNLELGKERGELQTKLEGLKEGTLPEPTDAPARNNSSSGNFSSNNKEDNGERPPPATISVTNEHGRIVGAVILDDAKVKAATE